MTDFSKFDVEHFNKHKDEGGFHTYELEDGTKITDKFISEKSGYQRRVVHKDSPLADYFGFYLNQSINRRGKYHITGFNVGLWEFFDEEGNVSKSKDWSCEYEFNWEAVIQFLNKEGIDLSDKFTSIRKTTENEVPVWDISYLLELPYIQQLTLSAKDGSILNKTEARLMKCKNHSARSKK